jgi:hypothetical protein
VKKLAALDVEVDYYRQVKAVLADARSTRRDIAPARMSDLEQGLAELERAVEALLVLHDQLVTYNLSAPTLLYSLSEPFVLTTTSGITGARPLVALGLILVACFVLLPVGCVVHHAFRRAASAVAPDVAE